MRFTILFHNILLELSLYYNSNQFDSVFIKLLSYVNNTKVLIAIRSNSIDVITGQHSNIFLSVASKEIKNFNMFLQFYVTIITQCSMVSYHKSSLLELLVNNLL